MFEPGIKILNLTNSDLDKILDFKVISVLDDSTISSKFDTTSRLLIAFEDEEESQAQFLGFHPQLVNFTSTNMTVLLQFNKFENVSATNFG